MRLFFVQSHEVPIAGGSHVTYMAGHFYQVDDKAFASQLIQYGVAETEVEHEARLAREAEPPVVEAVVPAIEEPQA